MPRWFEVQTVSQIERFLQSKCARPTAVALALFLLMPIAALAQGSPFDTSFTAIQSLFTGTIAKVASLVDVASARLWLIEGIPIDDVVTLLEARRRFEIPIALCRARAREIAQTAQRMIVRRKIA